MSTCDLPDADMLLYGYGKQWVDGEPTFSITMARQFAQNDDAGGDIVRVACEARYKPASELLEVGTFPQWVPTGEPDCGRAWLAQAPLAATRPGTDVADGSVPPADPRLRVPPARYRDLLTQREYLNVLRCRGPGRQRPPGQPPGKDPVQQSRCHEHRSYAPIARIKAGIRVFDQDRRRAVDCRWSD